MSGTTETRDVIATLQARGLVSQITESGLDEALATGSLTVYCGFDASYPSLHVGNLVPMMALAHFQRAVTLAPRDERLFFNLGNVLGAMNRPAESEAAFNRSLTINPDYPDAHNNLADLLVSRRRIDEALGHYARAVELNPDSAIIENNYGGALGSAGRYPEALRHVQRALQIDPSYAPARDNLEKLRRLGVGRDK